MRALLSKKVFIFFLFLSVMMLILLKTMKDVSIQDHIRNGYGIIAENIPFNRLEDDIIEVNGKSVMKATKIEEKKTEPTKAEAIKIEDKKIETINKDEKKRELKYILQWTSSKNVPFVYMGEGQKGFIERDCPHVNCFVTSDRNYLGDYTNFDVIAFSGPEVIRISQNKLPQRRSPHQKYAFASIESSDYYPVCSNRFDNYFNWTWTFRLDSEVRWGYLRVRDKNNNLIGPNKVMHWMKLENMDPVSEEFKQQLKSKTKAAAWFVSNCYSRSRREQYVHQLQEELKKYDLGVDIYGNCGPFKCSRDNEEECDLMIKEKYYFYLSFENSYSEDYVTEKLLHALEYDAIPIVYGAANYTRFMPDGIYLNAKEISVQELAKKMYELINSPEQYSEYFKWKNHYSYHRNSKTQETNEYCQFCTLLNNEEMVKATSVYKDFRRWWDPPNRC